MVFRDSGLKLKGTRVFHHKKMMPGRHTLKTGNSEPRFWMVSQDIGACVILGF